VADARASDDLVLLGLGLLCGLSRALPRELLRLLGRALRLLLALRRALELRADALLLAPHLREVGGVSY